MTQVFRMARKAASVGVLFLASTLFLSSQDTGVPADRSSSVG
jgi:hypothetical protein